jgi:hypothetical protein
MTEYTDSAGVRYIAKPQGDRRCSGCAHAYLTSGCLDAPPLCDPMYYGDFSRIIWVQYADKVAGHD